MKIEQKAKAYDEALKRAEQVRKYSSDLAEIKRMEELFPELNESEDERIRKEIISFFKQCDSEELFGVDISDWISWLEKQGKCETDCHSNHQDVNYPNGCIVLEDFNGGEGFYKLNLDYLSKKQVEEVEEMVRTWNKESKTSNENIKSCIGMCLTDANEQRFKDYNTTLKDCLAWLEKQGEQKEYTFKSIPRLLEMIEPSDRAKAYCQKLIDTLAKEGYNTDAKIVEEVLKGWNGEDVPMAVMDEQSNNH